MMRSTQNSFTNSSQRGFTLVEMLVSVALVLLMMTMFTSIFQMATNSVSKQRIIAETDQRSRSLTTILRADFAKRSMRSTFPFLPLEDTARTAVPFANRQGYIYISCNDPASGQDDLIQFTVDARQIQTNPDQSLYYGASKVLWDRIAETNGVSVNPLLQFSPNQPEADEGDMYPNGASGSNGAEVSIFLRGGNLIRRVMLLREPLPVVGQDLSIQPKSGLGNEFFLTGGGGGSFFLLDPSGTSGTASDDFWRHFDFSAVPRNLGNVPNGVDFIGIDALSNDVTDSLGHPRFRFGFNPVDGATFALSREHVNGVTGASFIGRYLHSETSSPDFNWPNGASSIGNPLDVQNAVALNSNTGVVTAFQGTFGRGGERRVEDVLMSNVREFRVELWDSRLERWVVPGHQMTRVYNDGGTPRTVAGDYHILRNAQYDGLANMITYGPLQIAGASPPPMPHVFDTWHPSISRDFNGNLANDIGEHQAPFYPLKYYPPLQTSTPPGPTSGNSPDPANEFDPIAGRVGANRGYWQSNQPYAVGDVVFASSGSLSGWDLNSNGVFDWLSDGAGVPRQSLHIAYRCVGVIDTNLPARSGAGPVGWQSPGLRFVDGNLLWEGFSNINPLRSVRLTIRFTEPTSETPKQLTLIIPLTDEER
jgi:prepilin-type N-terminal cleavage/methylation domain-containing protein